MSKPDITFIIACVLMILGIVIFLRSPEFKEFWKDFKNRYKKPEIEEEAKEDQEIDFFSDETKKAVKQDLENIRQERMKQSAIAMDKRNQEIQVWREQTKKNLSQWLKQAYRDKCFYMEGNGVDYCIEISRNDFFDDHPNGLVDWMSEFISIVSYLESMGWKGITIRRFRDQSDIDIEPSTRVQINVSTREGDMEISSSEKYSEWTQTERWKRIDGIFTRSNKAN